MNFQGFDARHLAILDMLFTECHVGRSAERLHLSQPAVSNALAWLRRHFDDPLLVRSGRTLRLTPFAERLRDPVRRLLLDFRTVATFRPHFRPDTDAHHFRIILSQFAAAMLMAPLLRQVAECAPNVTIECRPVSGDVNEFERGEVDLLIVPWHVLHAFHGRELLFTDEWVCAASAGSFSDGLTADAYRAARHVLPDTPQTISRQLDSLGIQRDVAAIVPHNQVLAVLAGTPWLATMPSGDMRRAEPAGLRIMPLPFEVGPLVLGMQWHREAAEEPASLWLRGQVRHAVTAAGLSVAPGIDVSLEPNDPDQQR